ncbi:MAG: RNA 2',3'-cyclic phosphodiesterase [Nitrosomonadales bacterium]|nr:RNA 2',3'-cyclic phosphodiesterase [Nitrosomonadales bacterium]
MEPELETARVFFALWPDRKVRVALSAWQPCLHELCGGRAMRAVTLHTTLVFLGEVATHRLEALQLAAREVEAGSFGLCMDTARYWGHNHIVYAAPSSLPPELSGLVAGLEDSLRRHHFRFDRRAYKPHVTLARNAKWTDAPLPAMPPVHWPVGDFALVQSVPDGGRADYRVLARFPLRASGG